jgi:hypothetical protein
MYVAVAADMQKVNTLARLVQAVNMRKAIILMQVVVEVVMQKVLKP